MRRRHTSLLATLAAATLCGLFAPPPARADKATPLSATAQLPVKEVTIFKDGHAFVLHAGRMPTDEKGNVVLDYLPSPVLGAFWPSCTDKAAKLSAVTASQRKVLVERTAIALRDLIEANVGADVLVTERPLTNQEKPAPPYPATIGGLPEQSGEELERTSPPNGGDKLPVKGSVVLLKLPGGNGTKVVPIERIVDVTFLKDHKPRLAAEEFRTLLTMKLEWADKKPQKEADVGMMYLQKGLRWIPSYKVTIDGKGGATVRLQGTLVNELCDLDDVTAHLVVGVPTFAFKDSMDPIALGQNAAQVARLVSLDNGQVSNNFSNSIMVQRQSNNDSAMVGVAADAAAPADLGPEVSGGAKSEDLFLFTVKHVSLKKGQRMVVPVAEYSVKYRDVYTLDVPFAPPPEVWRGFDTNRQAEVARQLSAARVMHKVRLANAGQFPFTTAPALIVKDDRVLAQGMMTYTAPGAETDLEVTTAIDIRVQKTDAETKRTPDATQWNGQHYGRIDLAGQIKLLNFGKQAVEVEVVRHVLGNVEKADNDGVAVMVNAFEDSTFAPTTRTGSDHPTWWGWYNWPGWWHHFNGIGRIRWTVKLEPGKPVDLKYTWNYYWR